MLCKQDIIDTLIKANIYHNFKDYKYEAIMDF
jgi:hypothetical protein